MTEPSRENRDSVEVPEMTDLEFSSAVAFEDAHPVAFATWQRGRGRPKAETPKVHVGFRMAAEVVDGIKATGKGYNARVERVLRDALASGRLDRQGDR